MNYIASMHKVLYFFALVLSVKSQSNLVWSQPNEFIVETVSIFQGEFVSDDSYFTNITFPTTFTGIPKVILSLSSLEELMMGVKLTIFQNVYTEELTYFVHEIFYECNKKKIDKIKIAYAAINLDYFLFFYPHETAVNPAHLSNSNSPNSEIIQIKYLNELNSSHYYDVEAVLSGFKSHLTGSDFSMSLKAQYYDNTSFFLIVQAESTKITTLTFTRILIDRTQQLEQASNYSYVQIEFDTVTHYENPIPSTPSASEIKYYPNALFYGVKTFGYSFNCLTNNSIFETPNPRIDLQIIYFSFLEKSCPQDEAHFEEESALCYESCQIGKYQITLTLCGSCHYSCYQCSGPSQFQCTKCLAGNFRSLTTSSQCQCRSNFFSNPPESKCKACSELITGCLSCASETECLSCDSLCTYSYPSCSCPPNWRICDTHEYFSLTTFSCQCEPQYFNDTGTCESCVKGCYLCEDSTTNCLECIDQYILLGKSCIFFPRTTSLLDGNKAIYEEGQRCLIKNGENTCLEECPTTSYFYKYKCYPYSCPSGTFEMVDANTGEMRCHACKSPCIQCSVYYQCERCEEQFYYLSQSSLCEKCPDGCLKCNAEDQCVECMGGYYLNSTDLCSQNIPVINVVCSSECQVCLISTFCEKCLPGYFLLDESHQCILCDLPGLQLQAPPPEIASSHKQCYEICGDGFVYNDQCDDANTDSGDGCSSDCTIEDGYICEYLSNFNKSACFKENFNITMNMSRALESNEIEIILQGQGISLELIPFAADCGLDSTIIVSELHNQKIIFTISFTDNLISCKFSVNGSVYIPEQQAKTNTKPKSLYVDEQNPIRVFTVGLMRVSHEPLSYIFWFICLLGISPFDIWVNYQFLALQYLVMHEKQHNPPGIYGIYKYLGYMIFNFNKNEEFESVLDGAWKLLILYGGVLFVHQFLIRLLLKISVLPEALSNIFKQIFSKRIYHYIVVHSIFQPLEVYFNLIVYIGGNYTILAMVITSVYLILMIATAILALVWSDHAMKVKNHRKYVLFLCLLKAVNILVAAKIYFSHSKYIITPSILTTFLCSFLLYTLFDTHPAEEVITPEKETSLSSREDQIEDNLENDDERRGSCVMFLTCIRKFNLIIIFSCLLSNCVFLMRYEYEQQNPQNYDLFSLVILMTITIGMVIIGHVLNFLAHISVIIIYKNTNAQEKQNVKEPEKSEERLKNSNKQRSQISVIPITGQQSEY